MVISWKLLNKFIDLKDININDFVQKLNDSGLEVGGIKYFSSGDNLVIGEIIKINKIPEADKLSHLLVDIGEEKLSIVCGAPNVALNKKVIVAKVGSYLPSIDLKIKKANIKGVESNGMCCSLVELGVDKQYLSNEQINGIEILDDNAVIGNSDPLNYLDLDDILIDIELTPDRGDCFNYLGLLQDLKAIFNRDFNFDFNLNQKTTPIKLDLEIDTKNCRSFSLRTIKGVSVSKSPKWLELILLKHGYKPYNNLVDFGNFAMIITGQPYHLYDLDKLESNKFVIRDDYNGEVKMLDNNNYNITDKDIVITNNNKVECLGGIIGSYSSMIDENTKNIAIEAANFSNVNIRLTAKRLNLFSESSARFIKEVDVFNTAMAVDFLSSLIIQNTTPKEVSIVLTKYNHDIKEKIIELEFNKIEKVLGIKIVKETIDEIFNNLGFKFSFNNNIYHITPPTRRNDLNIDVDIIEEIIRIYGFEKLDSTLPFQVNNIASLTPNQIKRNEIINYLINNSINEVITYSLINKENSSMFNFFKQEDIKIKNPFVEERSYMRHSLISSHIQIAKQNKDNGSNKVSIFEISKIYGVNSEVEILNILINKNIRKVDYLNPNENLSFYHLKGLLTGIIEKFNISKERVKLEPLKHMAFHSYQAARIILDNKFLGVIGQLHPNITSKIDQSFVLEINLDMLYDTKIKSIKVKPIAKYPSVLRDISILIQEEIEVEEIIKEIKRVNPKLIYEVNLFDVYRGVNITKGYKSLAFNIVYMDSTKTLNEEEINQLHDKVILNLKNKFNLIIR